MVDSDNIIVRIASPTGVKLVECEDGTTVGQLLAANIEGYEEEHYKATIDGDEVDGGFVPENGDWISVVRDKMDGGRN